MSTLVIKSIPREIHQFLKESARSHRRSLTQEVITILEQIVTIQEKEKKVSMPTVLTAQQMKLLTLSGRRKLVPGYLELFQSGAFSGGTDSSAMISEERDAK
jgi:plasmid stability protein